MAVFLWGITVFVIDIYVFYPIYHDELMPIITVFMMGLIADLADVRYFGWAGNVDDVVILCHAHGDLRLQQSEFMDLWLGFAVSCAAVTLFQLIVFSSIKLACQHLDPRCFKLDLRSFYFLLDLS